MINEKNAENYIDRIKRLKNEKKITNEQLSELTGIPSEMYDERLTTVSAHKILNENNVRVSSSRASVSSRS